METKTKDEEATLAKTTNVGGNTGIFKSGLKILQDWRNLSVICFAIVAVVAIISFSGNTFTSFFGTVEVKEFLNNVKEIKDNLKKMNVNIEKNTSNIRELKEEISDIKKAVEDGNK
jgi:sensor histidine kinase YesM